jgi:hypothetical protein
MKEPAAALGRSWISAASRDWPRAPLLRVVTATAAPCVATGGGADCAGVAAPSRRCCRVGPSAARRCIGGERECNFGSPLSSDAKCITICTPLLETIS